MEESYDEYLHNLTDDEGEVRELRAEDFRRMKPFSSLPASLQSKLLKLKRPEPDSGVALSTQKDESRPFFVIEGEIVERYRQTGFGWEDRVNQALREWLRDHAA